MTALRRAPSVRIDVKMQRCKLGEQSKHAIDRAQIAAPHPLVSSVDVADDAGSKCRAAKDDEDGFRVLIHADHLPVDGGAGKRNKWPAAPG